MTSDNELEELEQLYRSVVPDQREGAPKEVAAKAKDFARERLNEMGSKKVVSINEYRRTKVFWSGVGLAAGITLGIYVGTLDENLVYLDMGASEMVFMGNKDVVEAVKSLEDLSPDEWQRRIAERALAGEMTMVESLSKEFNRRFPDSEK